MNDYADKTQYQTLPLPNRKVFVVLLLWTIKRWFIQRQLASIDSDTDYWLRTEKHAIAQQLLNAEKIADGKLQLTEANRQIEWLSK